jgi:hypothetical protein
MRRIDELHLELPFYGSRRMTFELNKEGRGVNRKRVQRLMRLMGSEALVPCPARAKPRPGTARLQSQAAARPGPPRRVLCRALVASRKRGHERLSKKIGKTCDNARQREGQNESERTSVRH